MLQSNKKLILTNEKINEMLTENLKVILPEQLTNEILRKSDDLINLLRNSNYKLPDEIEKLM